MVLLVGLAGCDGGSGVDDGGPLAQDAGAATDGGGGGLDAGTVTDAGAPPADGGTVSLRCASGEPRLIVTTDDALHGGTSALLRAPIEVRGAVTGLRVLRATQSFGGVVDRTWEAAELEAPPGFDGAVADEPGVPAVVLFRGVADADSTEIDQCARAPWERDAGSVSLSVTTDQTGEVTLECSFGPGFGGRGPEPLGVACARGVPGWLPRASISDIDTPRVFRFMESETVAHNSGPSAVNGFVASDATVTSGFGGFPGETECASPDTWTPGGGTHQLWRGTTSNDTWTGPVAPGAEERAHWMWQEGGALLPATFCFPPDLGEPGACIRPVMSITLRGASSAGPWQWESDIFDCVAL